MMDYSWRALGNFKGLLGQARSFEPDVGVHFGSLSFNMGKRLLGSGACLLPAALGLGGAGARSFQPSRIYHSDGAGKEDPEWAWLSQFSP